MIGKAHRGARALLGVAALLAIAALSPLGAAAAGPTHPRHGGKLLPASSAAFTVAGSNGYSLYVRSERGIVTIVAADRRPPVTTISAAGAIRPPNTGNVAASTYYAFGSPADPRVIRAVIGHLGKIAVSFKGSGRVHITKLDQGRRRARKCEAPARIIRRLGTFTGTIKFRGENGYTTLDVRSARGSIGTSPSGNCAVSTPRRGASRARDSIATQNAFLRAIDNRSGVQFEAAAGGGGVTFNASWSGSLGDDLIVSRTASATAVPSSFAFAEALSSARVTPPAPFAGSASFASVATSRLSRWAGDLTVAFPGATLPLTGPRFTASLLAGY